MATNDDFGEQRVLPQPRLRKVVALVEQRDAEDARGTVGEAVAEVELGRVTSLAVAVERVEGRAPDFLGDGNDLDVRLDQQVADVLFGDGARYAVAAKDPEA